MRRVLLAVVAVLVAAAPARAQDQTAALLKVIDTLSQRVDALQARLDGPVTGAAAWVDSAQVRYDGKIEIIGWAVVCNEPHARVVLVIDNMEVPVGMFAMSRPERKDVQAFQSPSCQLTANGGVDAVVDWTMLAPDPEAKDRTHTAKIRIYDSHKRAKDSNVKSFDWP